MTRIGIAGARGRMGMMNVESVLDDPGVVLTAALEREGHPDIGKSIGLFAGAQTDVRITDDADAFLSACDVVIDFTLPDGSLELLRRAKGKGVGFVLGTTGFTDAQKKELTELSREIAIVVSPNMSVGVNALFAIVNYAAKLLGGSFDVEIIEAHHNKKKDAPSGTALRLAEIIASERGLDVTAVAQNGREGIPGERTKTEIGIHAVRAGDIVGEHTVMFCRDGERVEITHRAHSRKNFSLGALTAAKWLKGKPARMYSMNDALGIEGA